MLNLNKLTKSKPKPTHL